MEVAFFKRYPGKVFKHKQCIFRIVFAECLGETMIYIVHIAVLSAG